MGMGGRFGWQAQEDGWRKGPWTAQEDQLLIEHVRVHGEGRWNSVSRFSGLKRSGKSCRLRWVNYLRPDLKRGKMTPHEERIIIELHARWGNRWSTIARSLPGRTDNEIKNYWRTHFKNGKPSKRAENRVKAAHVIRQQELQKRAVFNYPYSSPLPLPLLLQQEQRHQNEQEHNPPQQQHTRKEHHEANNMEEGKIYLGTEDSSLCGIDHHSLEKELQDMELMCPTYMHSILHFVDHNLQASSVPEAATCYEQEGTWGCLWNLDDVSVDVLGNQGESHGLQKRAISY